MTSWRSKLQSPYHIGTVAALRRAAAAWLSKAASGVVENIRNF